ncbi:MAG: hypothetical protein IJB86_05905 [Clostridia bacterium]|nr:hypothetical protein [Clostridia bacterium]
MDLGSIDFGSIIGKIKDLIGGIDLGGIVDKVKPVLDKVVDFFKNSPSMFMALLLFLTVMFDPAAGNTDTAMLVNEEVKVLVDAALTGQGLTNDGQYVYSSGSLTALKLNGLAKFDMETMNRVKYEKNVLPKSLTERGNDHIGGISYYNGKIYAGVEASKGDNMYPCIVVFDAESLKYVTHYDLPTSWFPDGLPYVAVDQATGLLYTSRWTDATSIHVFDIDATMAHVVEIDITGVDSLSRIQGGEVYDGKLYLSQDTDGTNIKNVYAFDIETGETEIAFTRDAGKIDAEAEDITIYEAKDGSFFHVVDYNKIISTYIRSYIMIEDAE